VDVVVRPDRGPVQRPGEEARLVERDVAHAAQRPDARQALLLHRPAVEDCQRLLAALVPGKEAVGRGELHKEVGQVQLRQLADVHPGLGERLVEKRSEEVCERLGRDELRHVTW